MWQLFINWQCVLAFKFGVRVLCVLNICSSYSPHWQSTMIPDKTQILLLKVENSFNKLGRSPTTKKVFWQLHLPSDNVQKHFSPLHRLIFHVHLLCPYYKEKTTSAINTKIIWIHFKLNEKNKWQCLLAGSVTFVVNSSQWAPLVELHGCGGGDGEPRRHSEASSGQA